MTNTNIISNAQARAIYLLDSYNGGYVESSSKDRDWFIARVKPQIKPLLNAGLLRSNGFDGEYVLTDAARDRYQEWYSCKGFNIVEGWKAQE